MTYTPVPTSVVQNNAARPSPCGCLASATECQRLIQNHPVTANSPAPAPRDPEYITTRTGQIKLKRIPAGTFRMGSPDGEGGNGRASPARGADQPAVLPRRLRGNSGPVRGHHGPEPELFRQHRRWEGYGGGPVDRSASGREVSWLDAVKFCNALSEKEGLKPFYTINGETVQVPDWNGTGLSAADRGGVGIRLPGRDHHAILVR